MLFDTFGRFCQNNTDLNPTQFFKIYCIGPDSNIQNKY